MKKALALLLVLVMVLGLVACNGGGDKNTENTADNTNTANNTNTEATDDNGGTADNSGEFSGTVTIGCNLPLTGSVALNGEMILEGIRMAVDEVNAAGGINGMEVLIDAQDDQGEPNQAANVANMFVSDPDIVVVIGNLKSSCTLAAAPIYEEAGLVTIAPDSSSPAITDAGEYIFRNKDSDVLLSRTAVQAAIDDGCTKIAILYENNDFGLGVLEQAKIQMQESGLEPVCEETVLVGEQTDYSTTIANIKASGADSVLLGLDYNEAGLFMKQMKDAGLDLPRYGTDGMFTDALIDVAGEAANGTYALTSFHDSDPSEIVQNFIKDYQAYTGTDTIPSIFQAEGYDAAKIVMEAIQNAGTDRTAIRDYMATMSYQGVIGDCTFDENGDVNLPLKRVQVVDGKFVLLEQ